MQEERKNGYVAGIVSLLIFSIFLLLAINNEFNLSGQILWVITIVFWRIRIWKFMEARFSWANSIEILEKFV